MRSRYGYRVLSTVRNGEVPHTFAFCTFPPSNSSIFFICVGKLFFLKTHLLQRVSQLQVTFLATPREPIGPSTTLQAGWITLIIISVVIYINICTVVRLVLLSTGSSILYLHLHFQYLHFKNCPLRRILIHYHFFQIDHHHLHSLNCQENLLIFILFHFVN